MRADYLKAYERQWYLIRMALKGHIEHLQDLKHEISIPPISERRHLNLASQELLKQLDIDIKEYAELIKFINSALALDK